MPRVPARRPGECGGRGWSSGASRSGSSTNPVDRRWPPGVPGMAPIGPVYTPPHRMDTANGGAVTTATSVDTVARGTTDVVLFADVANPTSNSIYQKIGFRAIADDVILVLQPWKRNDGCSGDRSVPKHPSVAWA